MRRFAVLALAGLVLTTLTGCPATEHRAEPTPTPSAASASASGQQPGPAPATRASTDRPPYTGPPADAPASLGPLTVLHAAVDLTPATPTVFSVPSAAAATPDGRVLVLLSPVADARPRLATVSAQGVLTGAVDLPPFTRLDDLHALPDGRAVVVGELGPVDDATGGYGLAVVDPVTGSAQTTVAVRFDPSVVIPYGRSAVSADGSRAYLFVTEIGRRQEFPEQLVAIDLGTGQVIARRELTDDIAGVSAFPARFEAAGLVPRPDGGVRLLLDASPVAARLERLPTLLAFDQDLEPDGDAVRLTDLAEGAETQTVATGADGTVFVVVVVRDGDWVLAVPDGGGAGPVLAQFPDPTHDYALEIEPAQEWALLPSLDGVRAIDLRTGEQPPPLDLGCDGGLHVRGIVPSAAGAAVFGECGAVAQRTAMLWLVGP
jgi:hypothetical protein